MRVCLLFLALVAGCGSGTPANPQDMSMMTSGDQSVSSLCGHPGDAGNSKGVGKYCMTSSECTGGMASVCSTLMEPPQGPVYFCTFPCDATMANPCGENASCTCFDSAHPT